MLKNHSGVFLRYYLINSYYQRPINFSMDKMDQTLISLKKIQRFYKNLNEYSAVKGKNSSVKGISEHKMDDDAAFLHGIPVAGCIGFHI